MSALTAGHIAVGDLHPTSDQALLSTLDSSPYTFLQPPPSLYAASIVLAKRYIDPLATSTSNAQVQRQNALRRKRKRGQVDDLDVQKPLQLKEIHTDGLQIQQIWEQARRILDASRLEAERSLQRLQLNHGFSDLSQKAQNSETTKARGVGSKDIFDDDFNENTSEVYDMDASDKFSPDDINELEEDSDKSSMSGTKKGLDGPSNESVEIEGEEDSVDDDEEDDIHEQSEPEEEPKETFVQDKLGLNDGFFSIDDFNRQSDFLEHQDARGEDDGAASDEEEIDWTIDPLANTSTIRKERPLEEDAEVSEDEEEEGPIFGNMDLDGSDLSENDDELGNGIEMEDVGGFNNTNDIMYADFFAPPPRKASKKDRGRALPKTQPPSSAIAPQQAKVDDDIQRTISAVRRDIFEDDLTPDEDGADDKVGPQSTHEKRQAALTAEIRRLEAANVAKRDWTLSGEARAADRPLNSLLEEDLDFERAGKPIPVITQEVSEDIEALIKRRILAREFDEVIKRRPGNLVTGAGDVRRGRFELEDTKPEQSLAEVYEAEHLRNVDPEGYVDKRDEKLKKEHAKIEQMWKDVSAKLDALSSLHYKPKPPSASISVVADVPTISMEDARPSAGGDVGGEQSRLAPQEVYKAGEARDKKQEIVTGGGLPIGREEMTRDEKTRRRRREKERIRKAGGLGPAKGGREVGRKMKEKQGIVGDLKKGGVRVIGKKGEIRDVEGRAVIAKGANGKGGSGFKL
ncbi:U3 snoRNP protein [Lecanora helva]